MGFYFLYICSRGAKEEDEEIPVYVVKLIENSRWFVYYNVVYLSSQPKPSIHCLCTNHQVGRLVVCRLRDRETTKSARESPTRNTTTKRQCPTNLELFSKISHIHPKLTFVCRGPRVPCVRCRSMGYAPSSLPSEYFIYLDSSPHTQYEWAPAANCWKRVDRKYHHAITAACNGTYTGGISVYLGELRRNQTRCLAILSFRLDLLLYNFNTNLCTPIIICCLLCEFASLRIPLVNDT